MRSVRLWRSGWSDIRWLVAFEWNAGDIDDVLSWGARPLFHLVDMVMMDEIMQCNC